MATYTYKIMKSRNGQYYWTLQATNNEIILTSSEQYLSKQGCKKGIASSANNLTEHAFTSKKAKNKQFYFQQFAKNHKQLGRSEMYESNAACVKGLATVKHATRPVVIDTTVM